MVLFSFSYESLFGRTMESEILNHEKLTTGTVETFLNEIYSLNIDSNEKIVDFVIRKNIKFG